LVAASANLYLTALNFYLKLSLLAILTVFTGLVTSSANLYLTALKFYLKSSLLGILTVFTGSTAHGLS
jgi:hypothetical protein